MRAGDRVVGLTMLSGGMAEVAVLTPDRVFRLPDNVSFEAGAGLLFNDLTVYFALAVRGRLQRGETVLVHGAAGGIGTSALRLAPVLGASRTIAVVSSEEKSAIATAAGATDVVLADGFKDTVKELTNGRGVDVVVDPVGGDRFTDSLRSLAPAGRLLVIGFTGGEIPTVKVNRLLLNNIDVVGVGWGAWAGTHPGALAEQWAALESLLSSGALPLPSQRSIRSSRPARRWRRWRIAPPAAKWCCGYGAEWHRERLRGPRQDLVERVQVGVEVEAGQQCHQRGVGGDWCPECIDQSGRITIEDLQNSVQEKLEVVSRKRRDHRVHHIRGWQQGCVRRGGIE
ncbi:zinc-binding dehydrogenase family protein [Mycobacterium ulcerans str. Harvey]|uniref:Zinc-binding dehydrogenase family protein n=1 Tax=Mycobacterium ulcerans str. Harvey TaxID=1299332 RepID=A0ABN0QYF4_MYCUL|nr:zinc-binding dehydrogenase family protein [Mycobacterium ulcerans str. Harvey]